MFEHFYENSAKKTSKKYECKVCSIVCSYKSDWERHLTTTKHKNRTKLNVFEQNLEHSAKKNELPFMCSCGKIYKARNSLWYHKKRCSTTSAKTDFTSENIPTIDTTYDIQSLIQYTDDINKDTINTIVASLSKINEKNDEKLMKVLKEILPTINNTNCNNVTNTNSHNSINNNFNIQMFLNDKCKNAMNLTEFIETLPITSATYDHTIENGLTKTITNLFVDGLNNMDVLDRPIHCTDPSRKTLYIKENDVWEKDNNLNKIENSISKVAVKQRSMISKWQDANEGWDIDENLQTKMTNLVFNSMTLIENDEKEKGKIIRAISKNTHLTNDIKEEYK